MNMGELFGKVKTKNMKTEECGLFTREWGTGLAKNQRAWTTGKKTQISAKSGKKFYAKAFTVQYTGALWSKRFIRVCRAHFCGLYLSSFIRLLKRF